MGGTSASAGTVTGDHSRLFDHQRGLNFFRTAINANVLFEEKLKQRGRDYNVRASPSHAVSEEKRDRAFGRHNISMESPKL